MTYSLTFWLYWVTSKLKCNTAEQELGLNFFNAPLTAHEVGALGLTGAQNALSAASKCQLPVNFKIYESAQAVFDAQKIIPFSDWVK